MDYLVIFLQRAIELLAFYLILANIDGRGLKESFTRLFVTRQKNLYANPFVLVGYLLVVTFLISVVPVARNAYTIDHLLRPFVAHFLLRRAFNFKRVLLANIFSFAILMIVALLVSGFVLDVTTISLVTLLGIIIIAHRNYFRFMYIFISRKDWLVNTFCLVSLAAYSLSIFTEFSIVLAIILLSLFLGLSVYLHCKNWLEVSVLIKQIQNITSDNMFQILREISIEHFDSDIIHQYMIPSNNINKITPEILMMLASQKEQKVIKNYDYTVTKWQIKINVIV